MRRIWSAVALLPLACSKPAPSPTPADVVVTPEESAPAKVEPPPDVAKGRADLIRRLSALGAFAPPSHPDDTRLARVGFRNGRMGNPDLKAIVAAVKAAGVPASIDLQGCAAVSEEGVVELKSPLVRGLNLLGTAVSVKVVDLLATMPDLEELSLAGDEFGDSHLARVAGELPKLRSLTFLSRKLTEAGLAPLASLADLRSLTLLPGGPAVGDVGLKALSSLTRLEALELSGDGLTTPGLAALEGMVGLKRLTLNGTAKLTGSALASVGRQTGLEELSLVGCPFADDDLIHLRPLKNVRRLSLDPHHGDAAVDHLSAMTGLEVLDLSRRPITDASAKLLAELPRLRSLNLAETKVSDAGVAALAGSTSLAELTLDGCVVTDAGAKPLAALRNLSALSLAGSKVSDASATVWAGMPKLKQLSLADTPVGEVTVKALADHPALEELALEGTAITDASIAGFRALPKLKLLRIGKSKMTDAGYAEVEELLKDRGVSVFGK